MSVSLLDKLKSYPLYFLPHHAISRLVYALTRLESPLVHPVIRWFIKQYQVDMQAAKVQNASAFKSFNAFFTRELCDTARPVDSSSNGIASPVDAVVSQAGEITNGRIFQAKGHDYSLTELIGGDNTLGKQLENGKFTTLYLSPRDYHRIHMPLDGQLQEQRHVPGRLFSVAPHTVRTVPRLFARNERVIAFFDTPHGPLVMVLVGAINVAAIETVWHGLVTPPAGKSMTSYLYYGDEATSLKKGAEMGRFNMGSTVILLLPKEARWSDKLVPGQAVKMGEKLGSFEE